LAAAVPAISLSSPLAERRRLSSGIIAAEAVAK
jgi:hypothetical protein